MEDYRDLELDTIKSKMREVLADMFGTSPVTLKDDTPIDSIGMDSLERTEFAMANEEEFDLTIDDETAYESRTFGDFAERVLNIACDHPKTISVG